MWNLMGAVLPSRIMGRGRKQNNISESSERSEQGREQKGDSLVIFPAVPLLRCVYHTAVAGRFFEADFQIGCVYVLADVAWWERSKGKVHSAEHYAVCADGILFDAGIIRQEISVSRCCSAWVCGVFAD